MRQNEGRRSIVVQCGAAARVCSPRPGSAGRCESFGRTAFQQEGAPSGADAARANLSRQLAGYRAELAALTPAQRKADAWIGGLEPGAGSGLVPAGTPGARRLVTPNPAFYDATRPTEVQAIAVKSQTTSQPYLLGVQGEVLRTLDWQALAALLTPAR